MVPSNPERRRDLTLAWGLLALLTWAAFVARPFTAVDETRYIGVAWEMWLRGDFLVPYKNGVPYSDKPPLLFWLIHAGWALFGVNDISPRLILPLASAAGLWLTAQLAQRLWPAADVGGRAALILVSCLLWGLYSTLLMFDVLLSVCVLIGLHGLLDAAAGRWRGWLLLALAIGLGSLVKGPVIVLHLLPVALGVRLWQPDVRLGRWSAGLVLALAGGVLIALAWVVPAVLTGGEVYRAAILWGQTASRLSDSVAHNRPFWWYAQMAPVLLFPWFWWPRLWQALAGLRHVPADGGRARFDRGSRFCLVWSLPVLLLFCLISDKQPHYVAPLLPAFALLAARALELNATRVASSGKAAMARLRVPGLLGIALGLFFTAVALGWIASDQLPAVPRLWPALGLLALGVGVVCWRQARTSVAVLALMGALGWSLMQLAASSVFWAMYDAHALATRIAVLQRNGVPVANAARYHDQFHFAGRLTRPLVEIAPGAARPWLAAHPAGWVLVYREATVPTPVAGVFQQTYRGGTVALVNAQHAHAKNAAHLFGGGAEE